MSENIRLGEVEIVPVHMSCVGGLTGFSQPVLVVPVTPGLKRDLEDFHLPTDDAIMRVVGGRIHSRLFKQELRTLKPFSVILTDQDAPLVRTLGASGVVFVPFEADAESSAHQVVYVGLQAVQQLNLIYLGERFRSFPHAQIARPCYNKDWRSTALEIREGVGHFIASTPNNLVRSIVLPDPEQGFVEALKNVFLE